MKSILLNLFKSKLRHNLKLDLLEMKAATGMDIAKHVSRLAKIILTRLVTVKYYPLLIRILRLQRDQMKMKHGRIRS